MKFWILPRHVAPRARLQRDTTCIHKSHRAHAVPLHFKDPVRMREWCFFQTRERYRYFDWHWRSLRSGDLCDPCLIRSSSHPGESGTLAAGRFSLLRQFLGVLCAVYSPPRNYRLAVFFNLPQLIGELIAMLDQQPLILFLRASEFHQHEAALQFLPVQGEFQVALGELLLAAKRPFRFIRAAVPDNHIARAILPSGNLALKLTILEGVILDVNCQAFHAGVERWSFRHGPGFQYSVHLQAQVVMQTGS